MILFYHTKIPHNLINWTIGLINSTHHAMLSTMQIAMLQHIIKRIKNEYI